MNKKSIALTVAASLISGLPTVASAVTPSASAPDSHQATNSCCAANKTKKKSTSESKEQNNTQAKTQ